MASGRIRGDRRPAADPSDAALVSPLAPPGPRTDRGPVRGGEGGGRDGRLAVRAEARPRGPAERGRLRPAAPPPGCTGPVRDVRGGGGRREPPGGHHLQSGAGG